MKKLLKKIKKGDHPAMMDTIERMIDAYNSAEFENGRRSAFDDMSVYCDRLAKRLLDEDTLTEKKASRIIREFFELDVE